MTITLQVDEAQALAVQAMLKCWNSLGSMGSSRYVAFYVDGDGNFKPKATWVYSRPISELTDAMNTKAHAYVNVEAAPKRADGSVIYEVGCDHAFDFDGIYSELRGE
jgi:hypothetical protein